jgi:hypothetical protein
MTSKIIYRKHVNSNEYSCEIFILLKKDKRSGFEVGSYGSTFFGPEPGKKKRMDPGLEEPAAPYLAEVADCDTILC